MGLNSHQFGRPLVRAGFDIIGTKIENIDVAETGVISMIFESLISRFPPGGTAFTVEHAEKLRKK